MFASLKMAHIRTMRFVKFFCILSIYALGLLSCRQQTNSGKTEKLLTAFPYTIIGKTTAPSGTQVWLLDPENKLQQFSSAKVENGKFVLEGELAMPGFYTVQIKDKEAYTLFLEGERDYDLQEEQGVYTLTTSSTNAMDFVKFMAGYHQREKEEKAKEEKRKSRISTLNAQLAAMAARNDGSYERGIDEIQQLTNSKKYNLRDSYADFILDSTHRTSLILPYFFKYVAVDEDNFQKFDKVLQAFPSDLRTHPYYKFAREKVDKVKDFYENMPVFPAITPMNTDRDSLQLKDFSKANMLIAAFWKSSNRFSVDDIKLLRQKEKQLHALGVRVIYFSLDKELDAWQKSSKSLSLGTHSYYLNYNDRATMESDFGVERTPSYLWINPQTFKIRSLKGEDPALPDFIRKVNKFLGEN